MRFKSITAATISILLSSLPSFANNDGDSSVSIKDSQKAGLFLRSVTVKPNGFPWNGHQVTVRECWLERPKDCKEDQLMLSFNIDGRDWKEHSLANRRNIFLELKQEPDQSSVSRISFFNYLPPDRLWKAFWIFGGAYGSYIHFVQFDTPTPDILKLRVGTSTIHDRRRDPSPNKLEMSDVVLNFDLSAPQDNQER